MAGDSHEDALLQPEHITPSDEFTNNQQQQAQSALPPNASFYQLAYYQHYFDVTTVQIRSRLFRALLPFTSSKFYHAEDPNPDFYGPFWITTTLIFLLAAAGNFANYISFIADNAQDTFQPNEETINGTQITNEPTPTETFNNLIVWTSNFQKVTVGASVFYSWISIMPAAIYCVFARIGSADAPQKGLIEIASLFGYSLATFLPVCILCIPPVALLRWISVGVAFLWSSFFLIKNLGADVHNKAVFPVIAGIVILNFGIAVLTKFYFFDF